MLLTGPDGTGPDGTGPDFLNPDGSRRVSHRARGQPYRG
jgi:hypothetical protein